MHNITARTAQEAFEVLYSDVSKLGCEYDGTKALFNVGIQILEPQLNTIDTPWRKWSEEYANNEWLWYLSGDNSIDKLGEIHGSIPPIWEQMQTDRLVNSNYGWQWNRNSQLRRVIEMLKNNPKTRRAAISIYDAKELNKYDRDTPCTYAVQFTIVENKLNMSVYMRSNDLWFGFCNDQYCFSELQKYVAGQLGIEWGTYYHHAHNLHLYNRHLNRV